MNYYFKNLDNRYGSYTLIGERNIGFSSVLIVNDRPYSNMEELISYFSNNSIRIIDDNNSIYTLELFLEEFIQASPDYVDSVFNYLVDFRGKTVKYIVNSLEDINNEKTSMFKRNPCEYINFIRLCGQQGF